MPDNDVECYTKIPNAMLEQLIAADLSGQELRLILLIARKTCGFNKTEDAISLTQMAKFLSISKTRCSQVINRVQARNVVTVTENINGIGKKYKINRNIAEWAGVTENLNGSSISQPTVTVLRNEPLRKNVTTKEIITKETITKEAAIKPVVDVEEDQIELFTAEADRPVSTKKKEKLPKKLFLDCVSLTEIEFSKLYERFGARREEAIEVLNNYKMANNKKYSSDYHALIGWVYKKVIGESGGGRNSTVDLTMEVL